MERLYTLFHKRLARENTLEEQHELILLMADVANEVHVTALLKKYWEEFNSDLLAPVFKPSKDEEMLNILLNERLYPPKAPAKNRHIWTGAAVVTAAAIILIAGSLLFFQSNKKHIPTATIALHDITPGKKGATLSLANGEKISVSSANYGELAKEAGVLISKSTDGILVYEQQGDGDGTTKINTLATAMGETYDVRLPDGSLVKLNAASSLTYSANLIKNGRRIVELNGEGYFEITKNKKHPFIVKSRDQEIQVLGTHFNLKTYADESENRTTVVEGSVAIRTIKAQKTIKAGELAITRGTDITVGIAKMEEVLGWTKGDFYLNHVNFKIAMRDIARWYNIEVFYHASVPDDIESGGWISRGRTLSAVLRSIESSGLVKFRLEGRKLYVTQ